MRHSCHVFWINPTVKWKLSLSVCVCPFDKNSTHTRGCGKQSFLLPVSAWELLLLWFPCSVQSSMYMFWFGKGPRIKKNYKIIFSGQISLLFFKPCRGETFECLSSLKPIICHGATWCEWQCFCEMNMCLNCVSIPQEKKPYAIYIF